MHSAEMATMSSVHGFAGAEMATMSVVLKKNSLEFFGNCESSQMSKVGLRAEVSKVGCRGVQNVESRVEGGPKCRK